MQPSAVEALLKVLGANEYQNEYQNLELCLSRFIGRHRHPSGSRYGIRPANLPDRATEPQWRPQKFAQCKRLRGSHGDVGDREFNQHAGGDGVQNRAASADLRDVKPPMPKILFPHRHLQRLVATLGEVFYISGPVSLVFIRVYSWLIRMVPV